MYAHIRMRVCANKFDEQTSYVSSPLITLHNQFLSMLVRVFVKVQQFVLIANWLKREIEHVKREIKHVCLRMWACLCPNI